MGAKAAAVPLVLFLIIGSAVAQATSNSCVLIFNLPNLTQARSVTLNQAQIPLTPSEWTEVERLFDLSPKVYQNKGDIADHTLQVAMWVSNNPAPRVQGLLGQHVLRLLGSEKMMNLYQGLLGTPKPLFVRRLQGNLMSAGDHNHAHRDNEDDPTYVLAVVIYLTDPKDYAGGQLVITADGTSVKPEKRSLIAIRGDEEHAVAPFAPNPGSEGRKSIVVLLGEHDGPNPKFTSR
jgi:hypothetical protein